MKLAGRSQLPPDPHGRQVEADNPRAGVVDDGNVSWPERVREARRLWIEASPVTSSRSTGTAAAGVTVAPASAPVAARRTICATRTVPTDEVAAKLRKLGLSERALARELAMPASTVHKLMSPGRQVLRDTAARALEYARASAST